jgi:hypothetical protein
VHVSGFDIPIYIIVAILIANTVLLIVEAVGFRNLRLQIRDLKILLNKIQAKQKEMRELL